MTTLNEMIEIIKAENPEGLRIGDDEAGYTYLSADESEKVFTEWANARLEKESKMAEEEAAKASVAKKLETLGLTANDLKALGL